MTDAQPAPLDVRLMNATASTLVVVALLAGLVAASWWALRHPRFAIEQIEVEGDVAHNSEASLRAIVLPRLQGNFFTLDLTAAQSAFQSAPWVRRALVRREFPDTLRVTLQEHRPAAFWGAEDGQMIDEHGEVYEANRAEWDGKPMARLIGPDGQAAQVLATYAELDPLFKPLGTRMAELKLEPRGHWRARLESGSVIELGHGTTAELARRTRQFAGTVGEVAGRHQRGPDAVETADLRHESGYALRLRGIATVTDAPAVAKQQKR